MLTAGRFKISFWKIIAALFLIGGLAAGVMRFVFGLGATTNLSDEFPWGMWIGFDVITGVGLAAGGFTLCGIVYIFNLKRFKPIVRPAVLTAFLGYLLVIVGLMFDLGRPWSIWHAIIMWNHHSVMFEVAWCVMLYTTVLALEFSPVVLERFRLTRLMKIMKAITIPLVVAGVLLSMLHQSSLGTVYLIIPNKMHPFWYSPMLPVFFFVSAVAVGLGMTIVESYLSARAFNKTLETPLLKELARIMIGVLIVYAVMRLIDMVKGGKFAMIDGSFESIMLMVEFGLFIVAPIVIYNIRGFGSSRLGLSLAAMSAVLGFMTNRLNVTLTSLEQYYGRMYFPSVGEILITVSVVTFGFVAFGLAVKYLNIFDHEAGHEEDVVHLSDKSIVDLGKPEGDTAAQTA